MKKQIDIPKSEYEDTLLHCIRVGKEKGYKVDLRYEDGALVAEKRTLNPMDLTIDFQKRFEGMSNPADTMIYFAISQKGRPLGYFSSAFGAAANEDAMHFINKIPNHHSIVHK